MCRFTRHYVLGIENENGQHIILIGVAVHERNDVFDFDAELQGTRKDVLRD